MLLLLLPTSGHQVSPLAICPGLKLVIFLSQPFTGFGLQECATTPSSLEYFMTADEETTSDSANYPLKIFFLLLNRGRKGRVLRSPRTIQIWVSGSPHLWLLLLPPRLVGDGTRALAGFLAHPQLAGALGRGQRKQWHGEGGCSSLWPPEFTVRSPEYQTRVRIC